MFNSEQIDLSVESRGVVNPTLNLSVAPVSAHFSYRFLNSGLLINREENDNFPKSKIREVSNMIDEKINYIYVYLNPLKSGKFIYLDCGLGIEFDYEPFYIGKGQKNRLFNHLNEAENIKQEKENYNKHKINTIKKILKENKEPIIYKLFDTLINEQVYDVEKFFIRLIGRADKKLGPLTNLTDGGEGRCGGIASKETRKKWSIFKKGKTWEELYGEEKAKELKERQSESRKGKIEKEIHGDKKAKEISNKRVRSRRKNTNWHTEETKNKISNTMIEKGTSRGKNNPMFGKHPSEESRKKMSDSHKGKPPGNKGKPNKNKGKTYEEIYGEEKAKKIKEKRSKSCKRKKNKNI